MIIRTTKSALVEAVNAVKQALPTRPLIPVISGILIRDNVFTATDLVTSIVFESEVEVREPGSVVVSKDFVNMVSKLPDSEIVLESQNDGQVIVRYGTNSVTLLCASVQDYPELPVVTGTPVNMKLNAKRVAFAASKDESRPIFNGVLMDFANGKIVATDTHRMAVLDIEKAELPSIIVPAEIFKQVEGDLEVTVSDNHVLFKKGKTTYITRLINGQFPDYKKVIPQEFKSTIKINKHTLAGAVERVKLLSVTTVISVDGQVLNLSANSPDVGKIEEKLDAFAEGEGIEIAFNSTYISEGLRFLAGENVSFKFIGPLTSAIMEEEGFVYLMLPIRRV